MTISRVALFGKLNEFAYRAVEEATVACKQKTNPVVELEHWLAQLLRTEDTDLRFACAHFDIDARLLAEGVTSAIDRLPVGSNHIQDLSWELVSAIEQAWLQATLRFGTPAIRSGHLLIALLETEHLRKHLLAISSQFEKIAVDGLVEDFDTILARSIEVHELAHDGSMLAVKPASNVREIFISYRRDESRHFVARLYDRLTDAIGEQHVFKDVDSIPFGSTDFEVEIRKNIGSSKLVLVVIGPRWTHYFDERAAHVAEGGPDFVRAEVGWALEAGVAIVPVLFDDAVLPRETEMPHGLGGLSRCQAWSVRGDPYFKDDVKRLIEGCKSKLGFNP